MSGLPAGWEWDFDGARWFYRYKPTGLMQFNFPKPGDEFPEHVGLGTGPIDLAPEERLASERQVKRRSTVDGTESVMPTGSRTTKKPLEDVDEMSATGYFDPDNFMYLGLGGADDVSPPVDGEAMVQSIDMGMGNADSQVSSVAVTPSPGRPFAVVANESFINELDSHTQPAVPMLDGRTRHAELSGEAMMTSVHNTQSPVGFVAELPSADTAKCAEELAPIELDAWSHTPSFGPTDMNPNGPVELSSQPQRDPTEQKESGSKSEYAPAQEVEAYPVTSASFTYPPLRSDTASAPAQASWEQTRPGASTAAGNKPGTFQSWKPTNQVIDEQNASRRSSMVLSGTSVLQNQNSELGDVGPKRHSITGPMHSSGAVLRHPSILTPPSAPKKPIGSEIDPTVAEKPPRSPIPAVLRPAQGQSNAPPPPDPRQQQPRPVYANIPGSNARHESISSMPIQPHVGGATPQPTLTHFPSVLRPAHHGSNAAHPQHQQAQQAPSFPPHGPSNPGQQPAVQSYRPSQEGQPSQSYDARYSQQNTGPSQSGPGQHTFAPATVQMPGRNYSDDVQPIAHRVNTLPNPMPSYAHLPPRNGPGLLIFQEILASPRDPLAEHESTQGATSRPRQGLPQSQLSPSGNHQGQVSTQPNGGARNGIIHTSHTETESSQHQPEPTAHHGTGGGNQPANSVSNKPDAAPEPTSQGVNPPTHFIMDDSLPVIAPLTFSKPPKPISPVQGQASEAVSVPTSGHGRLTLEHISETISVVSQVIPAPTQVTTPAPVHTTPPTTTTKPIQHSIQPGQTNGAGSLSETPASQPYEASSSQDPVQTSSPASVPPKPSHGSPAPSASFSPVPANVSPMSTPGQVQTPTMQAHGRQGLQLPNSPTPDPTHRPLVPGSVHQQSSPEAVHHSSSYGFPSQNPSGHPLRPHASPAPESGSHPQSVQQPQLTPANVTNHRISNAVGSGIQVGNIALGIQQLSVASQIIGNMAEQSDNAQHGVSGNGQHFHGAGDAPGPSVTMNHHSLDSQPNQSMGPSMAQVPTPAANSQAQSHTTSSPVVSQGRPPQVPPGKPSVAPNSALQQDTSTAPTPPTSQPANQSSSHAPIAGGHSLDPNQLGGHVSPVTRPPSVSQSQVSSPAFSVASLHQTPSSTFSQLQGSPRPSHNSVHGSPMQGQHATPVQQTTSYTNPTTPAAQGIPQSEVPVPAQASSHTQHQPAIPAASSAHQQPTPPGPVQTGPVQPSATAINGPHRPQHSVPNQNHPIAQMHQPHVSGQSHIPQVAGAAHQAPAQWSTHHQQHPGQSVIQQQQQHQQHQHQHHQPGQHIMQQQPSQPSTQQHSGQPGQSTMQQHPGQAVMQQQPGQSGVPQYQPGQTVTQQQPSQPGTQQQYPAQTASVQQQPGMPQYQHGQTAMQQHPSQPLTKPQLQHPGQAPMQQHPTQPGIHSHHPGQSTTLQQPGKPSMQQSPGQVAGQQHHGMPQYQAGQPGQNATQQHPGQPGIQPHPGQAFMQQQPGQTGTQHQHPGQPAVQQQPGKPGFPQYQSGQPVGQHQPGQPGMHPHHPGQPGQNAAQQQQHPGQAAAQQQPGKPGAPQYQPGQPTTPQHYQQQPAQSHQQHPHPQVQIPGQPLGHAGGQLPQSAVGQASGSLSHQSPVVQQQHPHMIQSPVAGVAGVAGNLGVTWNGQQFVYTQQPGLPQQYVMQAPQAVQSPVNQRPNIQINQTQTQTQAQTQNQSPTSAQAAASIANAGREFKGWAKKMWKNPVVQQTTAIVGGALASEAMGGDGVAGAVLANRIYNTAQTQNPGNPAQTGRPPGPSHTQTAPAVTQAHQQQQQAMPQRPPQQAPQTRPAVGRPQPARIQRPPPPGQMNINQQQQQAWNQNIALAGVVGASIGGQQPVVYSTQVAPDVTYVDNTTYVVDSTTSVVDVNVDVNVNVDVDVDTTTYMAGDTVSMYSVDEVAVESTTEWSSDTVDYTGGDWGDGDGW